MTETQRKAMQQALAFTMREFATVSDFKAARAMVRDALEAALAELEPEPEPVACEMARKKQRDRMAETLKCLVDLAESLADATSVRRHERALIKQARKIAGGNDE